MKETYIETRPKTIFCDIDGTLVVHENPSLTCQPTHKPKLIPGVLEKLKEWDMKGYNIVLTTGRKESSRKVTERQLSELGIAYDQMIMGIGGGVRVLINDKKPYAEFETASAINLQRDVGIGSVKV